MTSASHSARRIKRIASGGGGEARMRLTGFSRLVLGCPKRVSITALVFQQLQQVCLLATCQVYPGCQYFVSDFGLIQLVDSVTRARPMKTQEGKVLPAEQCS